MSVRRRWGSMSVIARKVGLATTVRRRVRITRRGFPLANGVSDCLPQIQDGAAVCVPCQMASTVRRRARITRRGEEVLYTISVVECQDLCLWRHNSPLLA